MPPSSRESVIADAESERGRRKGRREGGEMEKGEEGKEEEGVVGREERWEEGRREERRGRGERERGGRGEGCGMFICYVCCYHDNKGCTCMTLCRKAQILRVHFPSIHRSHTISEPRAAEQ